MNDSRKSSEVSEPAGPILTCGRCGAAMVWRKITGGYIPKGGFFCSNGCNEGEA